MGKPTHNEAIRRGLVILGMMGPTYMTSRQIHSKLIEEGFSVSQRTVDRDLSELPNIFPQNISVNDRSKPFGYKLPLHSKKASGMSPAEAVCLQLAFDYLNPLLPNKSLDPIAPYLREAEAVLNMVSSRKMRNWKKKVLTLNEGFQLNQAKVSSEILYSIHNALWDEKMIFAQYTSKYKKKSSSYELHPGGLVYRGRISYLICSFDNQPEKIVYLPLHRFKAVKVIDKQSVLKDKDISDLAKGLLGFQVSDKKIKIKLKFSQMAGGHLYETPISKNQKIRLSNDGFIIVEDDVIDDMEFRFWIQGFADRVEVLSPKKLREEFKLSSQRLSSMYEKIKPNSLESIILFAVYISAQDGRVSDEEIKELIVEAPLLRKLYLDIYGEYIDLDMLDLTARVVNLLEPRDHFTGDKISDKEQSLFENLITDPRIQDVALLVGRHMASADGFHSSESFKYDFWSKRWIA